MYYRLSNQVNKRILSPPLKYKIVIGYKFNSGRNTVCDHIKKNIPGMMFDNTMPPDVPCFEYNFETMLVDMKNNEPKCNIYVSGVYDTEQFTLFKRSGFCMIKIKREQSKTTSSVWDFIKEDNLDYLPDEVWDIVLNNDGDIHHLYNQVDKHIINKMKRNENLT